MTETTRPPFGNARLTAAGVLTVIAAASGVLTWGVLAEDSNFRPTAPAALVVGTAVAFAALAFASRLWVVALVFLTSIGVVVLWTTPAGEGCGRPFAEFASHAVEDAAGSHDHDRCQLESDRRSIAGFPLAAGGAVTVFALVAQRRGGRSGA